MGIDDYTTSVNYTPEYLGSLFNAFTWLLPMILNAIFALEVMRELNIRHKKKTFLSSMSRLAASSSFQQNATSNEDSQVIEPRKSKFKDFKQFVTTFRPKPSTKFQIIIFSYWLQWIIPCVLTVIQPCNCIPYIVSYNIYWLV